MRQDSPQKKQALLNECRGNLLEYFLAENLALESGGKKSFYLALSPSYREALNSYVSILLEMSPGDLTLIKDLSELGKKKVFEEVPVFEKVFLEGKSLREKEEKKEADIVLKGKEDYLISLKMIQESSQVNSKSAGSLSFLKKYFTLFEEHEKDQDEFNQFVYFEFEKLARDLYERRDLEFNAHLNHFEQWKKQGYETLPGDLQKEDRLRLGELYFSLAKKLYGIVKKYCDSHQENFSKCLMPLLGFSDPRISQLHCLYKKDQALEAKMYHARFFSDCSWEVSAPGKDHSFFTISSEKADLFIRIKPMNEFTSPSYKVHCACRFRA